MVFKVLFFGGTDFFSLMDGFQDGAENVVKSTHHSEEAVAWAEREQPHLAIVDLDEKAGQPLACVTHLLESCPPLKVIGVTQKSRLPVVVQAIKMGVHEVINTQEGPHRILRELEKTKQQWQELDEGEGLHRKQKQKYDFSNIVGESPEMQHVFEVVSKIIRRKWVTVLLRGETGTGKELIARAIHYNSFEQFQPFVEINCNALPENLLESELFGYEKGAFTDAKTRKKGLFELAQNGTLFLDEIGEISPAIQMKLLKALEEKKIRRLGGTQDIQINTRIIAATNRDLKAAIQEGHFRNDLYYRLNVVSIHLPGLKERGDDIILLAKHFLQHFGDEYESSFRKFTPEAETLLRTYAWPGNVRELQHTIERIVLLHEGEAVTHAFVEDAIESDTPMILTEKAASTDLKIDIPKEGISLNDGEKFLIQSVLEKMHWNKRKTCQILQISRPRLDRKIKKYQIEPNN
ncbi:MAG: sigma 54-interacting transcriptional regulator [bacterium]